jgi:hypothetical protein
MVQRSINFNGANLYFLRKVNSSKIYNVVLIIICFFTFEQKRKSEVKTKNQHKKKKHGTKTEQNHQAELTLGQNQKRSSQIKKTKCERPNKIYQ